jgi:glycosyl hydrolase family 62
MKKRKVLNQLKVIVLLLTVQVLTAEEVEGPLGKGSPAHAAGSSNSWESLQNGRFAWQSSGPMVSADKSTVDPQVSVKDPTLVWDQGRWHVFTTIRMLSGKVEIGYLSFRDWHEAEAAPRTILHLHDQYYCAPQVFFFTPHKRWYLIYQLADEKRTPSFGPAYSTTETLSDPHSWSQPKPLLENAPEEPKWLDFWVICDTRKAHLFYTSLDGRMWRCETKQSDFPGGWSKPRLALQADIFEASHTYKVKGTEQYLTIVEAQGGGRRYYKAYVADQLEGPWEGLATTLDKPFAAFSNVRQDSPWTDNISISHGELVRAGANELMEVDPANIRLVFQGASDAEYRGTPYGKIPWRLGILDLLR